MPALMKGTVWAKRKHKMQYPALVEPKLDEIRCQVLVRGSQVQYLSYSGKPLSNLEPLDHVFRLVSANHGATEFDVGILCNGNFNDSYRLVRSKRCPDDLVGKSLEAYLYDLPEWFDTPYEERKRIIEQLYTAGETTRYILHTPQAYTCFDEAQVEERYTQFREEGFEGAMVKAASGLYHRKRTDDWMKIKPEADADGVIFEVVEAIAGKDQPELGIQKGDRLGRAGSVGVRVEDGSVAYPHGIAHDLGRDMWLNPTMYVGQWCEFKYMERDRQGGYRHPTFHRLREEK